MFKMIATNAIISKGYDGAPALRFSENGESKSVRFRVGMSTYDKNADKNRRFVNINVKAFNGISSRIESMKLDGGAYVNITGRYDEESWEDKTTHEKKSASVLIVDDIEFCHNGGGKQNTDENGAPPAESSGGPSERGAAPAGGQNQTPKSSAAPPDNFTGFEGFGETNPFFPEN